MLHNNNSQQTLKGKLQSEPFLFGAGEELHSRGAMIRRNCEGLLSGKECEMMMMDASDVVFRSSPPQTRLTVTVNVHFLLQLRFKELKLQSTISMDPRVNRPQKTKKDLYFCLSLTVLGIYCDILKPNNSLKNRLNSQLWSC